VRLLERLPDGRDVQIGVPTPDFCANGGARPPEGTYPINTRFDTKGVHRIFATFIPGNPWLASTSTIVEQSVAGIPTTTSLHINPVTAGYSTEVRADVVGSGSSMMGSISLFDTASGSPDLVETKPIPYTGSPSGSVTFQIAGRAEGTYGLEARYSGTSDVFEPSSTTADLIVGPAAPDTTPPTATAPSHRLVSGSAISSGRTAVRLAWTGSDADSGIARYELAQSTDSGAWATVATTLTSPTANRPLSPNHTYRFQVRAVDNAGNVGSWVAGPTFRLTAYGELNSRIRYTGSWATSTSSVYWGGKVRASSGAGARATFSATGRSVEWVARKGPTRGRAQIYVNGALVATVDLDASTYQNQRVVWAGNWSTSATRTISIKVLGTSGRPRVDLDAIVVGT
jgi:hypothetical protein